MRSLLTKHEAITYFVAALEEGYETLTAAGFYLDMAVEEVDDILSNNGSITLQIIPVSGYTPKPFTIDADWLVNAMQYCNPSYYAELDAGNMDNAADLLTSIVFSTLTSKI